MLYADRKADTIATMHSHADARHSNWKEQFRLALDHERAQEYHDETLPAEYFKSAEFSGMCGPKFCSMHYSRTIEERIAQLAKEADGFITRRAGD